MVAVDKAGHPIALAVTAIGKVVSTSEPTLITAFWPMTMPFGL